MEPEVVLTEVCRVFDVDQEALTVRSHGSFLRAMAALFLCEYCGKTQREAAEMLRIGSGAAVSQQLKKLASAMKTDSVVKKLHSEIETRIKSR